MWPVMINQPVIYLEFKQQDTINMNYIAQYTISINCVVCVMCENCKFFSFVSCCCIKRYEVLS